MLSVLSRFAQQAGDGVRIAGDDDQKARAGACGTLSTRAPNPVMFPRDAIAGSELLLREPQPIAEFLGVRDPFEPQPEEIVFASCRDRLRIRIREGGS